MLRTFNTQRLYSALPGSSPSYIHGFPQALPPFKLGNARGFSQLLSFRSTSLLQHQDKKVGFIAPLGASFVGSVVPPTTTSASAPTPEQAVEAASVVQTSPVDAVATAVESVDYIQQFQNFTTNFLHGDLPVWMEVAVGTVALIWCYGLVKVPWNLYFHARYVKLNMVESQKRGLDVPKEDLAYVDRLQGGTLALALGSHFVSAGCVWALSSLTHGAISPNLAWLFLGAAVVRPLKEFYEHMKARLSMLHDRAMHPRADLAQLREAMHKLEAKLSTLESESTNYVAMGKKNVDDISQMVNKIRSLIRVAQDQDNAAKAELRQLAANISHEIKSLEMKIAEYKSAGGLKEQEIVNSVKTLVTFYNQLFK